MREPVRVGQPKPGTLRRAAQAIRRGEVIAAPTDTLYGLLADSRDEGALRRLFRLKGRPENKPILLLIDSVQRLDGIVRETPQVFSALAGEFWPGPLTLVLPADPLVSERVTAGTGTVAVRLPRSPLVRALARYANCALTGTSANRSGRLGARSADEVAAQLGRGVPLILDAGRVVRCMPSTIVDLVGGEPRILREGRVSAWQIERALRRAAPTRPPRRDPTASG